MKIWVFLSESIFFYVFYFCLFGICLCIFSKDFISSIFPYTNYFYVLFFQILTFFKVIYSFFKTFKKVKNQKFDCRWTPINLNQFQSIWIKFINEVDWTWIKFNTVHLRSFLVCLCYAIFRAEPPRAHPVLFGPTDLETPVLYYYLDWLLCIVYNGQDWSRPVWVCCLVGTDMRCQAVLMPALFSLLY